ncbi:glycoside hydrolase family 18 protein [Streptomyces sp. NBC_01230]|nr:glycoside hydrolase family 18 protein [Streptomyces sp. NBC_01230]
MSGVRSHMKRVAGAVRNRAARFRWSQWWRTWPRRIALGLVLVIVVPLLTAGVVLRLNYSGDPGDDTRTRGRDAIWLGHAWVDGRKNDRDLDAFAERIRGTGIKDLYVHAGPLEHNGTLPVTGYPKARWLLDAVHRTLPGIRVQAWLGDVLATEGPAGLRLERGASRAAVVGSARQILDAGFDGVHFDLEPLHSGDRYYLSLLDDLHVLTKARRATLSVAAHQIDPLPAAHSVVGTLSGSPKWWSQRFFGQVARRVDQIAVMSYDTWMPLEGMYGGYVAEQTALALEVTPPGTDLLMGLPFFHENDLGHHEAAETVPAAVRGTRLGLARTDRGRERFGVALYVDFAARDGDWAAYREGWN